MIKDPYIGMPIIIDTSPDIPGGCGCFEDNDITAQEEIQVT